MPELMVGGALLTSYQAAKAKQAEERKKAKEAAEAKKKMDAQLYSAVQVQKVPFGTGESRVASGR